MKKTDIAGGNIKLGNETYEDGSHEVKEIILFKEPA
jgi:hypothetical protein